MLKRLFLFIFSFLFLGVTLIAVTNTWNGSFNSYWHNDNNWSLGHIPLNSEDVVIPSGLTRYPAIDFYDENCSSLTIESGATIYIYDQTLNVLNNVSVSGSIEMQDGDALLICNNITWNSGSTCNTVDNSMFMIKGIWEFATGSTVHLDNGYVEFMSSGNSFIRSNSNDSYFNIILVNKDNDILGFSSLSSQPLNIHGALFIYSNSSFQTFTSQPIYINKYIRNQNGEMHLDYGTVYLQGNFINYFNSGDYFNNLIIQTTGTLFFDNPIEIKGNLTIASGTLNPQDNTITVGGNWSNNVGDTGFMEGSGRVIFNGSGHQYCSNEHFNILEVNKSGGALRLNGSTVTCESYDWTSGALDVLSGTFTANDLVDDGIFGNWYLNSGGTINIYQDDSQYVDLNGNLHIYGGTFNVYGSSDDSYWTYANDASIEMSNGTLDFKDVGIYFYNSATYTLTTNITGGTIKTTGNVLLDNSNFTPNGGTIELYGDYESTITQDHGSIYNLSINKFSSTRASKENISYYDRNGIKHTRTRALKVNLGSDLEIDNSITIIAGSLDLQTFSINTNQNFTVYGNLIMTNSLSSIHVSKMFTFQTGSSSNITQGDIYVDFYFAFKWGTTAFLDTTTTLTMGGVTSYIRNQTSNSFIGNLNVEANSLSFDSSTDTIRVKGNLNIAVGSNVHLESYSMIVDKKIEIPNTSSFTVTTGTLINNNDLELNGLLSMSSNGLIRINGEFDVNSTGTLQIDDGNFYENGSHICHFDGTLTMGGGTIHIPESLFFGNNPANITNGTIYANLIRATSPNTFQPSNGTVILTPSGLGSLTMDSSNYFINLTIDSQTSAYGIQLSSNIEAQSTLTLTKGMLKLNGHTFNTFTCDIYGQLTMDNSSDSLIVTDILTFRNGSTSNITDGYISCRVLYVEQNSTASIGQNVTTAISTSLPSAYGYIVIKSNSFSLGDLIIDTDNQTELLNMADTLFVRDLTIRQNRILDLNSCSMKVNRFIMMYGTSTLNVNSGHLVCDTPWNLFGTLNLTTGTILVNNSFDIAANGILNISDNGTLTEAGSYIFEIYGNLSMSNGQINTSESIEFKNGSTTSISGGEIITKALIANYPGTLNAGGGKFILTSTGTGSISVASGNSLYDLEINSSNGLGGSQLTNNLEIDDKITISNGFLKLNGYTLNTYQLDNYSQLIMDNNADSLIVSDFLTFKDGSTSNITNGYLSCRVLEVDQNSNATIGQNVITSISTSLPSAYGYIIIKSNSFSLGDLIIDTDNQTELFNMADTLFVLGDLTIKENRTLELDTYSMKVNGDINMYSNSTMNVSAGYLICETPWNLTGTVNLTSGTILVNDSFDISSNGTLNIAGGNFYENGFHICNIDGTLIMSGGNLHIPESLFFGTNAANITGGNIYAKILIANSPNTFQPLNGKVILNPSGTGGLSMHSTNYFRKLEINAQSQYYGIQLSSNISVNDSTKVTNGFLKLNGYTFSTGKLDIYGQLIMDNNSDNLSVAGNIIFEDNSTSDITSGNIACSYLKVETYSNATLGENVTTTITSTSPSSYGYLIIRPSSFTLGNLVADTGNPTVLFGIMDTLFVLGDLTINSNKTLDIGEYNMKVNGHINMYNSSTLTIGSGSLTNQSYFTLNGNLNIGNSGTVLINSYFDVTDTGSISITNGTFREFGNSQCDFRGTLNFNGGIFYLQESLKIYPTATINISNGLLSCNSFTADSDSTFQPTGGIVQISNNDGTSFISLASSNYFHNLYISSTGSVRAASDILIQNDFDIRNGQFDIYDKTVTVNGNVTIDSELKMINNGGYLNISGDMIWNSTSSSSISNGAINLQGDLSIANGSTAVFYGTNTVIFSGNIDSQIDIYALNSGFSNLTISKNATNYVTYNHDNSSQILDIGINLIVNSGTFYIENGTMYVYQDTQINGGELRLNDSTTFRVGNKLIVNNTATLNAVASSGNNPLITALNTGYEFSIESGGTISAENVTFEKMDANGLNIKAGAAIDPAYPLNSCTFRNSEGVLLTINNNQTITINNATFIAGASKDATVNVRKTVNTGNVTFTNASGSFAGPDYEDDIYNRIAWSGFGPDLQIINVSYSDTNPYLADDVIATVTIQNAGNAAFDGSSPFYVDFFNNPSSAPNIGDYGDEYIEIQNTAIAKNDTIQRDIHISNNTDESWNPYLIVDTDNLITEINENNNIFGPADTITWNPLPAVSNLQISLSSGNTNLTWQYPISADSYKIYKTTDPYDFSGATILTSTIKRYTEATSGDRYFYTVTAIRNYPPSKAKDFILTKKIKKHRFTIKKIKN